MYHQMAVTFCDVAASFTEEQWSRLEKWQKELYQNVVREIHRALNTLGYKIENPEILFKIKKTDDVCVRIDFISAERKDTASKELPDLLIRIKEEPPISCTDEELSDKDNQDSDVDESFLLNTPNSSLSIKDEQPCKAPNLRSPKRNQEENHDHNAFLIKEEEEIYSIDNYNSGLGKSDGSTGDHLEVKQDPDFASDDDETLSSIIPVVVKQEESNSSDTFDESADYYGICEEAYTKGKRPTNASNLACVPRKSKQSSEEADEFEVIETKVQGLTKKDALLPRFRIPTCEERDSFIQEQKNKNTMRKTKSDISTLLSFTQQVKENRKIEEIPHAELDLLLSKFILALKRKDGKEYEPHTVRCLIGSIDRYLKEQNYPQPILHGNNREFPLTNKTLSAKIKYLKKQGKGNRTNKGEALTDDDIEKLYKTEILSLHNPTSLLNLLFFNNGIHFALRTKEQYDLQWGDITLNIDDKGNQYLEYNERRTKTLENPQNVRVVNPRMYGTPETPERDPIVAYLKFKSNRPPSMLAPDSPFYLAPNMKYNPGYSLWYRAMKIGIHKMRLMMTSMKIKASLPESRRIKNNLIRKNFMQNFAHHHLSPEETELLAGQIDINSYFSMSEIQQPLFTMPKGNENYLEAAASTSSLISKPMLSNIQERKSSSRRIRGSVTGRVSAFDSTTYEPPNKRSKVIDLDSD
ncbi:hypothetical protein GDO86_012630 [Hymenochirus boettgeri]|uniref:KRAB domain-containing protein n=1 Tax=Hymenochirus boettgeri TaxID=247094 RepID=A0A8T2ITB0_9PIPI|nr:hypothetical protein GDO86_012630 [Hymenochirus boettgeri]KAG8434320.1 hypothetical protein GDO86_012630 [Hymenochirus boettgeri]